MQILLVISHEVWQKIEFKINNMYIAKRTKI